MTMRGDNEVLRHSAHGVDRCGCPCSPGLFGTKQVGTSHCWALPFGSPGAVVKHLASAHLGLDSPTSTPDSPGWRSHCPSLVGREALIPKTLLTALQKAVFPTG